MLQQIYGYEDLHMLQSRLPMVSLITTHLKQLLSSLVLTQKCFSLFGCCAAPLLIRFCPFSPLCRITMESHSLAPRLCLAEMGALPTTPTQVRHHHPLLTLPDSDSEILALVLI